MQDARIGDLQPLNATAHIAVRSWLAQLSDDDLLRSVRQPAHGDYLIVNVRTGYLHDGNGRALELQRRAADPMSTITFELLVPVDEYIPDLSMFPDLE